MLKMALMFYVLVLSIGALSAVFRFIFDVSKWHKLEKKVTVSPSIEDTDGEQVTENNESVVNIDDLLSFSPSDDSTESR